MEIEGPEKRRYVVQGKFDNVYHLFRASHTYGPLSFHDTKDLNKLNSTDGRRKGVVDDVQKGLMASARKRHNNVVVL